MKFSQAIDTGGVLRMSRCFNLKEMILHFLKLCYAGWKAEEEMWPQVPQGMCTLESSCPLGHIQMQDVLHGIIVIVDILKNCIFCRCMKTKMILFSTATNVPIRTLLNPTLHS
mgnify:CR=1 FL=1